MQVYNPNNISYFPFVVSHQKPLTWIRIFVCLICEYFSSDSDEIVFSIEKAILWIDGSYFNRLKLKTLNDGFVSYKHATFHFIHLIN